ncbi:hypothetical protein VTN31DRAFT_2843 [Thermomyces dupontii]|uniref:uncharacterized protein n=1 Tax=Talaromyces thermophilus TaxID=28565 RepID=UPI003743F661
MDNPPADSSHSPISSPAPAYIRSSPPPAPSQRPPPPPNGDHAQPSSPARSEVRRKPVLSTYSQIGYDQSISPTNVENRNSSATIEEQQSDSRASSPLLANISGLNLSSHHDGPEARLPARTDSLQYGSRPPSSFNPRHTSASTDSWPLPRDEGSQRGSTERQDKPYRLSNSSQGSLDTMAQQPMDYQPLHYHHQGLPSQRKVSAPALGGSGTSSTEHLASPNQYLSPNRGSYSLSGSSSTPDLVNRGRSPNDSPSPYARRPSAHSPDNRPMSAFVDMLNTSYPQPSPSPGEAKNDHLRMFVGNNASLLSHKQTFEMYLANVKKTNDPAVQYEFAVFMVNAIQEMDGTMNDSSASLDKDKDKEPGITRSRLLSEAKAILQRLADKSYPYAQYYLADGYSSGLFNKGKVDYDRALPLFVAASKHGHAEASYRAGLCNEFGWGCRVDGGKAAQFYRQAAAKNHPGAMLRLGRACLAGEMGLGKRYREGIKWLKRAAESADEQYNAGPYELGLLHETGYGDDVFKDESYAAQLFTKSADLGHVEACFRMGEAYEYGKLNCPRDPALSIHFYTLAAQRGHPKAQMALCAWYMLGAEPVLEKDEMEAYEWARKAAEQGYAKAQYAVGCFTEMGIGCHRDPLEANVWYVRAADQGDERARNRLAVIQAASEGADPTRGGKRRKGKRTTETKDDKPKSKLFGIF